MLEDSRQDTRDFIEEYLKESGYEVLSAASFDELSFMVSRKRPALILMDAWDETEDGKINAEFSGMDFLKKKLNRSVPVIGLLASEGQIPHMKKAGAVAAFDKFYINQALQAPHDPELREYAGQFTVALEQTIESQGKIR